jgi:hypothetical protein
MAGSKRGRERHCFAIEMSLLGGELAEPAETLCRRNSNQTARMWAGRFRLESVAMLKLTAPQWIIGGLATMAAFILVSLSTAPH